MGLLRPRVSKTPRWKGCIAKDIQYHFYSNIYSNYRIKRNEVILIVKEEHIQRDTPGTFCIICSGKGDQ